MYVVVAHVPLETKTYVEKKKRTGSTEAMRSIAAAGYEPNFLFALFQLHIVNLQRGRFWRKSWRGGCAELLLNKDICHRPKPGDIKLYMSGLRCPFVHR